jgi:cell division protein FtsQ
MKKVLNIGFKILLLAFLVVSLSFTGSKEKELLCNDLRIEMLDTLNSGFLKKIDIEKIILKEESEILGYPLKDINTRKIENRLRSKPYIKSAEIFYDMEGILSVKVIQRTPIIRIITGAGNSYYLDEDGYIFRPRGKFTPHILIANGYFSDGDEIRTSGSLMEIEDSGKFSEWFKALQLARYIENDKFWKAQFVQAYVNSKAEFELIPRVGAHQIILGDVTKLEEKFKKLMTLYTDGLNYEGWNKYEKINLKYKNQVICTKR